MTDQRCKVSDCERRAKSRGWCNTHYERWRRHGDPLYVTPRSEINYHPNVRLAAERVLERIQENDAGCWVFMGAIGTGGYGRVGGDGGRGGGTRQAHRVVYESMRGRVPKGMDLDHLCRNRACCNPDHLEVVTRSENNRRGNQARNPVGHAVALMRKPHRPLWLAKRKRLLGATDVSAVLGYNPWKTPLDVWMDKTGRVEPEDLSDKYSVQRGLLLESLLINEWARKTGAKLLDFAPLMAHPDYPHIGCSLDAVGQIDGQVVPVEIKTASYRQRTDWWDETKQIPDHYAIQVLMQLAVTGLERAHVAADIAGDFRTLTIERDREFEAWALPALADWWKRHVVGGEEPDIDPVRDYPSLKRLWVPDPGVTIDADPLLMSDIRAYRHASAEAKERKQIVDELKGRIRIAMRESSAITDPDTGRRLVSVSKNGALRVAEQ
jgi:putative phage-type endonuclease